MRWDSVQAEGYQVVDIINSVSWNPVTNVFEFYGPWAIRGDTVWLIIAFQSPLTGICFAIVLCVREIEFEEEQLESGTYLRRFLEIRPKEESKPVQEWLWDLQHIARSIRREGSRESAVSHEIRAHRSLSLPFGCDGRSGSCTITVEVTEETLLNQEITLLKVDMVQLMGSIEKDDEKCLLSASNWSD